MSGRARVYVWGRRPPPVGGVTRSVERFTLALRAAGHAVTEIDPRTISGWVRAMRALMARGQSFSVFHASGPNAAAKFSLIASLLHHDAGLFIHAGDGKPSAHLTLSPGLKARIRRFDRIWVSNAIMRDRILDAVPQLAVEVASPFSPAPLTHTRGARNGPTLRLLLTAYNARGLYNAPLAVHVVEAMLKDGASASLTIISYGEAPTSGDWDRLAAMAKGRPWLTLRESNGNVNIDRDLSQTDVYLRLTETDGDSLAVREALSSGCRVVASRAAPRPAGAELTTLAADEIAHVIQHGGEFSHGEGLGPAISEVVRAWIISSTTEGASPDADRL